jgi:hypothetical protein
MTQLRVRGIPLPHSPWCGQSKQLTAQDENIGGARTGRKGQTRREVDLWAGLDDLHDWVKDLCRHCWERVGRGGVNEGHESEEEVAVSDEEENR